MSISWEVELRGGGIYLPQIGLWCDAPKPAACSFVSHAHFDHLAAHKKIVMSEATRRLMAARLPGKREEIVLPFDALHAWDEATYLRLHPAGHIFGSAMLHVSSEGETLLYTGDFKLKPGLSAEPCLPPRADTLIMETTFGLPRYVFPSPEKVWAGIVAFCRETLAEGATPVLFAYSLGKSQELLCGLAQAGLSTMLHPQTERMTRICQEAGHAPAPYRAFAMTETGGYAVICPPQTRSSGWLEKIPRRRTAIVSGWALDTAAIYRYKCEAAFPLSDHADFNDLLQMVELTRAKRVFTVHGYAAEFAATLRERGVEAWALGEDNQLEFSLDGCGRGSTW
ncbi:MAG TPA: MBL fold metallo-hydrolase [Candidatus Methylacidiphilales bacterium]|nr:MBL fold metallo-hydrolase [Candidatus Methylacidiphilales bacterium]